jgi:hypothetical protein
MTDSRLNDLSDEELDVFIAKLRVQLRGAIAQDFGDGKTRRLTENRLQCYRRYLLQQKFHDAGPKHRERLVCAGNQLGKTTAGSFEVAYHATGGYPDDWKGKRFDRPTVGWSCVRGTVQRLLVGRFGSIGTGAIPKDAIIETVTACGIADLIGTIKVLQLVEAWYCVVDNARQVSGGNFQPLPLFIDAGHKNSLFATAIIPAA